MPAWNHKNRWSDKFYETYRNYVADRAPQLMGTKDVDCADLSITLLVEFAAKNSLPVTFIDADKFLLCSKSDHPWKPMLGDNCGPDTYSQKPGNWSSADQFITWIRKYIQVKSLYLYNTIKNNSGPQSGDLLMRYKTLLGKTTFHHAALIFAVYLPGTKHPKAGDASISDYPGDDEAMKQHDVTQYFKGTLNDSGKTAYRGPDSYIHFDYLNSRGDDKRNAELIYYANATQLVKDDFEFRMYSPGVLDNWDDWHDTKSPPPRPELVECWVPPVVY
jgi:hypothetical protein